MTLTSFGRLARLYHDRMMRLFSGSALFDVVDNPAIAQSPEFRNAAWKVARGMVREVARANEQSWREAAVKSMRARRVFQALGSEVRTSGLGPVLEEIARRNAQLITSIPAEIAQRVTGGAVWAHQEGSRAPEISAEIRRLAPHLAASRISLIARTEISRAETDLTRARSERIGIEWYQWQASADRRVRRSHRNMDQVLVAWAEPPQPESLIGERGTLGRYHAGCAPNCRCVALPLASIDEIKWPARVLRAGRIVRMTRVEFTRAVGMPLAA